MREQFEKLPRIAKIIPKDSAFMFSEEDNCYFDYDDTRRIEGFINGAWYSFQEQQKKIDKLSCNHLWTGKSENQYCSKCGEVD